MWHGRRHVSEAPAAAPAERAAPEAASAAAAPAAPASGPRRPSPASSSARLASGCRRHSPDSSSIHHGRVLSEAILQTQRDSNESVGEVVAELFPLLRVL